MNQRTRGQLGCGFALMLFGAWMLALRLFPVFDQWVRRNFDWPVLVIGAGVLMLAFGLLVKTPGMGLPAGIVAGIGGLLYWQNATGNWASWAYAWALIPGFVGLGLVLMSLMQGEAGDTLRSGGWLMVISLVFFFGFGSLFGDSELLGPYWPILLILLGLYLLGQPLLRGRGKPPVDGASQLGNGSE